jgi:chemotaxis protein MotB
MNGLLKTLLACGVLASLLNTGGCLVPKHQLDAMKSANDQANRLLRQVQEAAAKLQQDNKRLLGELDGRQTEAERQRKQAQLANDQYAALKQRFDELYSLYQRETERGTAPTLGGPLPVQVDRALRRFADSDPDLMEYLPEFGMVKFKSDLTFSPGAADVQSDATKALAKLVEILQSPEARNMHVYIAGHTDDIPIGKPETRAKHPDNWHLSVHRAIGVERVLTKAGLDSKRIGVMGFGEYHPIAPNKPNKKGNRLNRRVEIWILPPNRQLTGDTGTPGEVEK